MDQRKMAEGVRMFLEAIDHRFEGDDMERTPERVARAWVEDLVSGYAVDPLDELTWTAAPANVGAVLVRDVSFSSVCVHHLLPFFGMAQVAYLPAKRLVGLSKIGRALDAISRRLQTQENLTASLVRTLQEGLEPRGVVVLLDAEHTCMTLRGVRKERAGMQTMASSGVYADDPAMRAEILRLFSGAR